MIPPRRWIFKSLRFNETNCNYNWFYLSDNFDFLSGWSTDSLIDDLALLLNPGVHPIEALHLLHYAALRHADVLGLDHHLLVTARSVHDPALGLSQAFLLIKIHHNFDRFALNKGKEMLIDIELMENFWNISMMQGDQWGFQLQYSLIFQVEGNFFNYKPTNVAKIQ